MLQDNSTLPCNIYLHLSHAYELTLPLYLGIYLFSPRHVGCATTHTYIYQTHVTANERTSLLTDTELIYYRLHYVMSKK